MLGDAGVGVPRSGGGDEPPRDRTAIASLPAQRESRGGSTAKEDLLRLRCAVAWTCNVRPHGVEDEREGRLVDREVALANVGLRAGRVDIEDPKLLEREEMVTDKRTGDAEPLRKLDRRRRTMLAKRKQHGNSGPRAQHIKSTPEIVRKPDRLGTFSHAPSVGGS